MNNWQVVITHTSGRTKFTVTAPLESVVQKAFEIFRVGNGSKIISIEATKK